MPTMKRTMITTTPDSDSPLGGIVVLAFIFMVAFAVLNKCAEPSPEVTPNKTLMESQTLLPKCFCGERHTPLKMRTK